LLVLVSYTFNINKEGKINLVRLVILCSSPKLVQHYYTACQEQQGFLDENYVEDISEGTYANKAILAFLRDAHKIL
jgi:hypothetical protein